jgi:hypothetical protein
MVWVGHEMTEAIASTTVFSLSAELPASLPKGFERDDSVLDAACLAHEEARLACHIRKFTAAGATLRIAHPVAEGDPYELELANGQCIPGHVSWYDDGEAGFLFHAPIDVVATLARNLALQSDERRHVPRVELHQHLGIRHGTDFEFARTRDLSQGGVGIETNLALQPGDEVQIAFHGLSPLAGTVKWTRAGKAGIEFDTALAWQTLMPWLRQAQKSPLRVHAPRNLDDGPRFSMGDKKTVVAVNGAARVREGARWWNIQVLNLTPLLVEFECATPLAKGAPLWLWLPGFPGWPAHVIEAEGQHYLAEFRMPLRAQDLAALMPNRMAARGI